MRPSSRFFKPVNKAVRKISFAEKAYSSAYMQAQKTVSPLDLVPTLLAVLADKLGQLSLMSCVSQVAKLPWLKRLPGGHDTGRLTISLAESICFRAAIKPVRPSYYLP